MLHLALMRLLQQPLQVFLSALASHTPVVISDVDGIAELVENGFLFQYGSTDDMERILRRLTLNQAASRAVSVKIKYLCSTRKMTEDIVYLYESVLGG